MLQGSVHQLANRKYNRAAQLPRNRAKGKGRLSGSSYAGMNRIKFAGLIVHLSAFLQRTPGSTKFKRCRELALSQGLTQEMRYLLHSTHINEYEG